MQVTFARRDNRTTLTCLRPDGSIERADLGPSLPYHDLAHFVAESELGLEQVFFAGLASGRSVAELSDAEVIPTLGPGAMQAKVAARGVASLATGACHTEQFEELVNSELRHLHVPELPGLSDKAAADLLHQFQALVTEFDAVADGDSLSLNFRLR